MLTMGYIHKPSFPLQVLVFMGYTTFMVSIIMYGLGQILVIFVVNKITINMLLYNLSCISTIIQSFSPILFLVFEINEQQQEQELL